MVVLTPGALTEAPSLSITPLPRKNHLEEHSCCAETTLPVSHVIKLRPQLWLPPFLAHSQNLRGPLQPPTPEVAMGTSRLLIGNFKIHSQSTEEWYCTSEGREGTFWIRSGVSRTLTFQGHPGPLT